MKLIKLLSCLLTVGLTGCGTTASIGTQPNVAPVKTGIRDTGFKIKETRTQIKKVQETTKQQGTTLDQIISELDTILK